MTVNSSLFDTLTTRELYEIVKLRQDVFILEQACLYADLDETDYRAWHCVSRDADDGRDCIVAYARVFMRDEKNRVAQIGRVVTAKKYRGQGRGKAVVRAALNLAQQELHAKCAYIEAQTYAKSFYKNIGFKVVSDEFIEDGIPHVKMTMELWK